MNEEKDGEIFHRVARSIDEALGFSEGTIGLKLLIKAAYSAKDPEGFNGMFSLREIGNDELESIKRLLDYPLGFDNQEASIDNKETGLSNDGKVIILTYRARNKK